jgi:mono/diheme cytochrome c family protein
VNIRTGTLAAAFCVSAAACSPKQAADAPARWYTQSQIHAGRAIFQAHCSSCHGERAEGTSEWRELGPDGHYPPPPLNGAAHAWHHSFGVLDQVIAEAGA